jgi:hypothetical protein
MNYPIFRHRFSGFNLDDSWETIAAEIKLDWSVTKSSDGFYLLRLNENPKIFFAADKLSVVISTLEKYMGHKWMVEKNLMYRGVKKDE